MGFFSGRVSFTRHRVDGPRPGIFGPEHLERLVEHRAGRERLASADGVEVGWTAGDHILDMRFDLAKNVCNDTLHFALRTDTDQIPGDLMRAYYQVELEAISASNPSGHPSLRQKRQAREAARERLEDEAKDGRFRKRKAFPVLWDGVTNELLAGTASSAALDRLATLWEHTFGSKLVPTTAGSLAFSLAEVHQQGRGVDDARPTVFLPGLSPEELVWVTDDRSRDFLGNEYLLWLWFVLDVEGDAVTLGDGSEATVMVARSLVLECPRGLTGKESISSEGPARLPEARRAIQSGKMPRKAGLTVVRHDAQYELTLTAETLSVSGARLPAVEGETEQVRRMGRVDQIRGLIETLDLLYDAFCKVRTSAEWPRVAASIRQWLQREERRAA
jgi:hypothetical protein